MRISIIIVLLCSTLSFYSQNDVTYTLDHFVDSAKNMSFDINPTIVDSVVFSSNYDFNKFMPNNHSNKSRLYKTYYINNKVKLIEYYSDTKYTQKEYQCFVNDYDSIKYFIFGIRDKMDNFYINHFFGVNIKSDSLTIIFASHDQKSGDSISHKSKYNINWLSSSYYSGLSVFIVDSNLIPTNRLYFVSNCLIYFTQVDCNLNNCSELIYSYNPILENSYFNGYFLERIDLNLLGIMKYTDALWSTIILRYDFPPNDYFFKWEYYKFFIGKNWFKERNDH